MSMRKPGIFRDVLLITVALVLTGKPGILYRSIELIRAVAAGAELTVLPSDVPRAVDKQHAVVRTARRIGAIGRFGLTAGRPGPGHQRQFTDALCVVGADDGRRREVRGAPAKLPDDIAAAVDFNHTIVELVGDEVVAGLVELAVVGEHATRNSGERSHGNQETENYTPLLEIHCSSSSC